MPEENHDIDFDQAFHDLEEQLGDVKQAAEGVLQELPMSLDGRARPEDFIELEIVMHVPVGFVRQLEYGLEHVRDHNCATARRYLNGVLIGLIGRFGTTAREAVEARGEEAREHARTQGWTPETGWPQEMIEEADRLEAEQEAAIIQRMIDDGVIKSADEVDIRGLDHKEGEEPPPGRAEWLRNEIRRTIGGLWHQGAGSDTNLVFDTDDLKDHPNITIIELGPNSGLSSGDEATS